MPKNNCRKTNNIILISLFFAVIVLDQITKRIVAANNTHIEIIDNLFSFLYTENRGAAFSFLTDKSWAQTFFIVITFIALIGFGFMYYKSYNKNIILEYSLALIISGAIGNLIDRIAHRYVVDFISIHFFPAIFNVADIALTIGAGLFILHYLFFDKDAVFKKKINDEK